MAVMASSAVDQPLAEIKSLKTEEAMALGPAVELNHNGANGHEPQSLSNGDVSMTDAVATEILSVNGKSDVTTESSLASIHIEAPILEQPILEAAIVEQTVSSTRDLLVAPPLAEPASADTHMTDDTVPAGVKLAVEVVPEAEQQPESEPPKAEAPALESIPAVEPSPSEPPAESIPEPAQEQSLLPETFVPDSPDLSEKAVSSFSPPAPSEPVTAGVVRPRDDDEDDEPSAKRTKVDDEEPVALEALVGDTVMTDAPEVPSIPPSTEPGATQTPAEPAAPPPPKSDFGNDPIKSFQRKWLAEQIRKAKKIKDAMPFLHPVDHVALNIPRYPEIVKQPMDLSTIDEKLKADKYTSPNEFWADFELMVNNAILFNSSAHPIGVNALNLRAYFQKLMSGFPTGVEEKPQKLPSAPRPPPPRRESRHAAVVNAPAAPAAPITPVPKTPTASKPAVEHKPQLDPDGVPIIRRDSTTDRPKRDIIKPQRDLPYNIPKPKKSKKTLSELRFCDWVNKELAKPKYTKFTWPFQAPVDAIALNIPTYYKVIKKPMDFGTMAQKLNKGEYDSSKEYFADAKTVFQNCYKFNPPMDDIHKCGKQSEEAFDELWAKKEDWLATNAPSSEPASEHEEEEDDDDEDEDEETLEATEHYKRLVEIQKQIAALSSEAMSLSATPAAPLPKKQKKQKSIGGEKKKRSSLPGVSTSQKPAAAPAKVKKVPKVKKLSLEDKRYVSEGIAQLDEPSMRKAVQIIRNGVPSLKDVHDDELELDVDEIPDPVLQDLYRFVKQHRKAVGADVTADDDDYEEPAAVLGTSSARRGSGGAGAGSIKPAATQRKKNKPMSAREQESKIAQVKRQLEQFGAGGGPGGDLNDESSDDEESSSSEEE